MDSFWGLTATAWTAIGTVAGVASLATAVIIAVIVQLGARRAEKAAHSITRSTQELIRRGRRDDLLQRLRAEDDPGQLMLLSHEVRATGAWSAAERLGLEKAYFTNPNVPLLSHAHQLPQDSSGPSMTALVKAVIESLPTRYRDTPRTPPGIEDDLAHLTRLSIDLGAPTFKIAEFLIEKSTIGWDLSDGLIRAVLHPEEGVMCPPNLEAAQDYLFALQHHNVSTGTLVNVIAGVSLAIWDSHRLHSYGAPAAGAYTAYIMLMQRALASIGDEPEPPGATISMDHALAVVVDALGLTAGNDQHLNMRALEALNPILGSIEPMRFAPSGIVADHFIAGIQRLLLSNAPGYLRAQLRELSVRLVPLIEEATQ